MLTNSWHVVTKISPLRAISPYSLCCVFCIYTEVQKLNDTRTIAILNGMAICFCGVPTYSYPTGVTSIHFEKKQPEGLIFG